MLRIHLQNIFCVLISMLAWQSGAYAQQAMSPLTMPHYGEGNPETVAYYGTTRLDNGELVPWFPIETVYINRNKVWKSVVDKERYLRLKRNVLRVLPYAIYAQKRYEQLDREREIKEKINNEVKNLSVSQGKILIKLIERQTGNTSYELVKDMRGSVSAFVYQGVARVFGHNLKTTYDPNEDFEIENIIREYEMLRPINKPYQ